MAPLTTSVRTRFAPSPTGPLHIGGVRTALYAYLFARKHGGEFLLRIEDTDRKRFVEGAEDYIVESLKWCGIQPDKPSARQSDDLAIYRREAERLVTEGNAYLAFDTPGELEAVRLEATAAGETFTYDHSTRMKLSNSLTLSADEVKNKVRSGDPCVVRLKVPAGQEIRFTDLVRQEVSVLSDRVDDKVLLKSDGMPTYHLAHVIDDHLSGITHVIRGEEWLPSAPAHVLLYRFLGWEDQMPEFAHLPLILKPDGKGKLSKRDGDRMGFPVFPIRWKDPQTSEKFEGFREAGYYPESFINMLALLGWNPGTDQEVFTMEELIGAFSVNHIHKAPARFDPDKARWFNAQWLQRRPDHDLAERLGATLEKKYGMDSFTPEFILGCVRLLKPRVQFEYEMPVTGSYLFEHPVHFDDKVLDKKWKAGFQPFFESLVGAFNKTETFNASSLEEVFRATAESHELKPGKVLQLLRVLVTGESGGVDLFPMLELFGKEKTLKRLANGLAYVSAKFVDHG